jgi:hypothetical protein
MHCPLPQFPSTNAIPPPCFYEFGGLAHWLNHNPQYKQYFAGYFPYIIKPELITSSMSSLNYNPADVPTCSEVTTLNAYQRRLYSQQIREFQKIYAFNSNAYVNYLCGNTIAPIYYTFKNYQDMTVYNSGVSLINKLYPFQIMAEASTLNWSVPFPLFYGRA